MSSARSIAEKARYAHDFFRLRKDDPPSPKDIVRKILTKLMRPITRVLYDISNELVVNEQKLNLAFTELSALKSAKKIERSPAQAESSAWDKFYQRFEETFRGDYHSILERHRARYGERLKTLHAQMQAMGGPLRAVDLGCGRAEFLELAKNIGFLPEGVDISEAAIEKAKAHNIAATVADSLAYLRSLPDESVALVSSFHMIEHCPPVYVFEMVREAFRCLGRGGVLLMETPSAISVWVTARQFHLDPTHQNPVHPEYLQFLARDSGFTKAEVLTFDRPQIDALRDSPDSPVNQWLFGAQDLATWNSK